MPRVEANTKSSSDGTTAASVASDRNASASAVAATVAVSTMHSSSTPWVTGTGARPVRNTCQPLPNRRARVSNVPTPGNP